MGGMGLGDILRRHRERLGLSQEQLAEAAGGAISANTIGNIERGRGRPYRHTLESLADALGLSGEEREELLAARAQGARTQSRPTAPLADPIPSLPVPAPVLPSPATPLVGREREADEVGALLERSGVRLVTLTGVGGTGKTRLALEVASRASGSYRDGVRFVDLSAIRDPELVPSAMASALGIREDAGQALAETLSEYLRGRQMLLVLDNLEQVLPAAPLVGQLLSSCPGIRVLATSRVRLQLYGEHEYSVPPLGLPEESDDAVVLSSEAVRLFVERAGAIRPGLELTSGALSVVAEICHRLDGLPLAIELAAGRVRLFTPVALLSRLSNRLGLLTGGPADLPERQRTLRAMLDWSYDLLDEGERTLLARLGLFSGGFDMEAAEVVCGSNGKVDVLGGVESLTEQSLLVMAEGSGGEPRFRMLETVREYALARLSEHGGNEELRRRHAEHYLEMAETAEAESRGPRQAEWLHRLDVERENMRAALSWTREDGRAELGLGLAAAMVWYWRLRGHWSEALRWLDALLAAEQVSEPPVSALLRAKALNAAALLALMQGDFRNATESASESLEVSREAADAASMFSALNTLGNTAHAQGDYGRAAAWYGDSLAGYRDLGDEAGISGVLNDLGVLARDRGDWEGAMAYHEESLSLRQQLGDRQGIAHSLRNLGLVAHLRGDYVRAESLLLEALGLFRELGDASAIADSLNNLGLVPHVRRDWRRSTALFEESLLVYRHLMDKKGVSWSLNNLGLVAYDREEYERAVVLHRESLEMRRELGSKWGAGISLYDLGNALHALGESESALEAYRGSLVLLREVGDKAMMAFALEGLGRAILSGDRPELAVRLWGAADALRATIAAPLPPPDQPLFARAVSEARAALGDEVYDSAWQEGTRMHLDEAIAEAVSEDQPPASQHPSIDMGPSDGSR